MCVHTCTCVCVACIHMYRYRYTAIHTYLPRHQCGGQRITGRIWFSVSPYGSRGWNSGLVDLVARVFVCWAISRTKSSKSLLQLFPSIAETHRGVQYHHSVYCVCICSGCLSFSVCVSAWLSMERKLLPTESVFPPRKVKYFSRACFSRVETEAGVKYGQVRWPDASVSRCSWQTLDLWKVILRRQG